MKKIISLLLVVALTATAAIGGTLAYLTDKEEAKINVFSVDGLDISLKEETGVIGEGGEAKNNDKNGTDYEGVMPGDFLQKEVTVTNDESTPAYVAVTVTLNNALAINNAIDEVYGNGEEGGQAMYDIVFAGWGINQDPRPGTYGKDARGVIDGTYGLPEHVLHVDFTKTMTDYWLLGNGNWFLGADEKANQYWVDSVSVDGFGGGYYAKNMDPYEICYTYYLYLPAGESTTLFEGLNVPAEFDAEQMKMFDGLNITVEAAAIQADNIPVADKYVGDPNGEAKTAFELLAGQMNAPDAVAIDAVVSDVEELNAAVAAGAEVIWLNDGTYDLNNGTQGKSLTLIGDKGAVITPVNEGEWGCDYGLDGSTVTFIGLTIDTTGQVKNSANQDPNYPGFARINGTYSNVTFKGTYAMNRDASFDNCTFIVEGDKYNLWTWGANNASFTDCTFDCSGKAVLVYNSDCDVDFTNCVFNDNGDITGKSAIETGADYGPKTYNINLTNCTVNGFDVNDKNEGYQNIVGNKNPLTNEYLNIVIDGVDVY